jgi:hypothetical protein
MYGPDIIDELSDVPTANASFRNNILFKQDLQCQKKVFSKLRLKAIAFDEVNKDMVMKKQRS